MSFLTFLDKIRSSLPKLDFYAPQLLDIDGQIKWLYQKEKFSIDKIVEDLCYDRSFCEANGIDYCSITSKEKLKIREYVIKVLKV